MTPPEEGVSRSTDGSGHRSLLREVGGTARRSTDGRRVRHPSSLGGRVARAVPSARSLDLMGRLSSEGRAALRRDPRVPQLRRQEARQPLGAKGILGSGFGRFTVNQATARSRVAPGESASADSPNGAEDVSRRVFRGLRPRVFGRRRSMRRLGGWSGAAADRFGGRHRDALERRDQAESGEGALTARRQGPRVKVSRASVRRIPDRGTAMDTGHFEGSAALRGVGFGR